MSSMDEILFCIQPINMCVGKGTAISLIMRAFDYAQTWGLMNTITINDL